MGVWSGWSDDTHGRKTHRHVQTPTFVYIRQRQQQRRILKLCIVGINATYTHKSTFGPHESAFRLLSQHRCALAPGKFSSKRIYLRTAQSVSKINEDCKTACGLSLVKTFQKILNQCHCRHNPTTMEDFLDRLTNAHPIVSSTPIMSLSYTSNAIFESLISDNMH